MLHLTIWMNTPTFYQADLYRVLAVSKEVDIQVMYARKLSFDRLQLGWQNDLAGYPYSFLNKRCLLLDAVRQAWLQRKRIHIVNGIWGEPAFLAALLVLELARSTYTIYSESPDPTLHRATAKKLAQKAFGRFIVQRAAGFFPISRFAIQFYRGLGAREKNMYPFGYFRSQPQHERHSASRNHDRIEVVFVGQITHRKGVDLLLQAILPLLKQYPSLFLSIIGVGDLSEDFKRQLHDQNIEDRILLEGAVPTAQIPIRLAQADLLVLPSRWDGWGIVVNEAFSVGLPVVVSDRCGAADLVQNGVNGYVFRSGDVAELQACIRLFLEKKDEWPSFQAKAAEVGKQISAESVAPYLIACLKNILGMPGEHPRAPWEQTSKPSTPSIMNR